MSGLQSRDDASVRRSRLPTTPISSQASMCPERCIRHCNEGTPFCFLGRARVLGQVLTKGRSPVHESTDPHTTIPFVAPFYYSRM